MKNVIPRLAILTLLLNAAPPSSGLAQENAPQPPAPPATPSDAPPSTAEPPADKPVTVEELIARFEQLDRGMEDPALLKDLTRLLKDQASSVNPNLLYLRGRGLILAGQGVEGTRVLEQFAKTADGARDWRVHLVLGRQYLETFPEMSRARLVKAAELNAAEPMTQAMLAQLYSRTGEWAKAEIHAERAIALDQGKRPEYLFILARVLSTERKWAEALVAAERCLAATPPVTLPEGETQAMELRQYLQLERQILAEGLKAGTATASMARLVEVGLQLLALERTISVARLLQEVKAWSDAREGAGRAAGLVEQGRLYLELGRRDLAREALDQAAAIDPATPGIQALIEALSGEN